MSKEFKLSREMKYRRAFGQLFYLT